MRFTLDVPKVLKAIDFAKKAHKNQKRKGSGGPYYYHPITVAFLVVSYKRSKHLTDLVIAAILHDVLEDTDISSEKLSKYFGAFVTGLVLELTNDSDAINKVGKKEYLKKKLLHMSSYALLIKLCDRLHNVSDQPPEQMKKDTVEIMDFLLAKRTTLTRAQSELVNQILSVCRA